MLACAQNIAAAGGETLPPPHAKTPHDDDEAHSHHARKFTKRLRGSCDFCTRRKRKCDGDPSLVQTRYGADRCSFCIAKNQPECHYSLRLLTGPRPAAVSTNSGRASSKPARSEECTGSGYNGNGYGAGFPGGMGGTAAGTPVSEGWGGHAGGGMVSTAMIPLKRARLSPSPATGLIGLKENAYIGDFFQTMGFLPITSESFIRKAMVSTMFRTMQERDPEFPGPEAGGVVGGGHGWGESAMVLGGGGGGGGLARAENAVENAAAACVLWSTVGVGCLIRGRPKSSVEGYVHLAREALSVCFDDGTAETARAFTAMALFQDFMGNEDKFIKYIDFAKSIINALPPEKVPADLLDTHLFVKACDMLEGYSHRVDEEYIKAASGTLESCAMAKEPRLIHQKDLCRWLLKADIRLTACFSVDMLDKGAFNEDSSDVGRYARWEGDGSPPGEDGGGPQDVGATRNPGLSAQPHVVYDEGKGGSSPMTGAGAANTPTCFSLRSFDQSTEPPPPGEMSLKFAAELLPECDLMVHATQTPEVKGGVGELYFHSIMAYANVLQGRQSWAMDGLWRCADIFLTSPGICRLTAWTHLAHCTLACLLLSGRHEKYESLRQAYNSVMDEPSAVRAPPAEEWTGMECICKHVFCRSLYCFFMTIVLPQREKDALAESVDTAAFTSSIGDESKPSPPHVSRSPMPVSPISDEPWARGALHSERQGGIPSFPAAEPPVEEPRVVTAAAAAAATGFVGAFGGDVETPRQQAGGNLGARSCSPCCGPGATSSAVSIDASYSGSGGSSSSSGITGPVEVGTGGVAAPAPAPAAEQPPMVAAAVFGGEVTSPGAPANRVKEEHVQREGSVPSQPAQGNVAAAAGGAGAGAGAAGRGGEVIAGLELLVASELDGTDGAGLLDAFDELLGEDVLNGFGQDGDNDTDAIMLPFFEGNP